MANCEDGSIKKDVGLTTENGFECEKCKVGYGMVRGVQASDNHQFVTCLATATINTRAAVAVERCVTYTLSGNASTEA